MPLACGYNDGISRLERHSLQKKKKKTKTQMKKFDNKKIYVENLKVLFLEVKLVML